MHVKLDLKGPPHSEAIGRLPSNRLKEAVDFPAAYGLVAGHRLYPQIMVAWAKIHGLPVRADPRLTSSLRKNREI